MSNDLFNDIWGPDSPEKAAATTSRAASGSPIATDRPASRPLFHSDDDDEDMSVSKGKKNISTALPEDVEAMFRAHGAGDDDDDDINLDIQPMVDLEKVAQEAQARHAKTIPSAKSKSGQSGSGAGSSSKNPLAIVNSDPEDDTKAGDNAKDDKEKKKRKPIAKMDETRLAGENGIAALLPSVKKFKPRGKGHEAADLDRALEMYQLWAHRMYPKTQFRDVIERTEKLTHSRRMMAMLSVWRDEFHHGPRKREETPEEIGPGAAEDDSGSEQEQAGPSKAKPTSSDASRPPTPVTGPSSEIEDAGLDELMADLERRTQKTQPSSQAPAEDDLDDEEAWAVAEAINTTAASKASATSNTFDDVDDDEMWDIADEMNKLPTKPPPPKPKSQSKAAVDEDAALWDGMDDDMDEDIDLTQPISSQLQKTTSQSTSPTVNDSMEIVDDAAEAKKRKEAVRKEFEEGWDDMYE